MMEIATDAPDSQLSGENMRPVDNPPDRCGKKADP